MKPHRQKSVWLFLTLFLPETQAQINRRFLKVNLKITRILGLLRPRFEMRGSKATQNVVFTKSHGVITKRLEFPNNTEMCI